MNAIIENKTDTARRVERLLFALSIIWYCWFLTPLPNWNVMSRVTLASSIVLDHKIDIDRYHEYTGDIACFKGHFYSDKAPGSSWMSLPPLTAFSFKFIVEPKDPWQVFLMTLFVVSIPSALLTVLLFRFIYATGGGITAALAASIAYAFGTLAFPYATLFYSHQTVALLLFAMFMIGYKLRGPESDEYGKPHILLLYGFLFGALFTTEYPASLPAAVIAFYTLLNLRGFKKMAAASCLMAAGAAIPIVCWLAYNTSVFQSLIAFGYHHECLPEFKEGMSQGVRGFTAPKAKVVYDLFLLPGRGLLFLSPFLILAIPGLVRMVAAKNLRREAAVISLVIFFTAALNVTIFQPSGGASLGPRYLVPMLPFCALAMGLFMSGKSKAFSAAFLGCAAVAAAQMFIGVITNPQPPRGIDAPLFSYTLPMLLDGYIRPGLLSFLSQAVIIQIAPPIALSVIAFVFYRQSIYLCDNSEKNSPVKLISVFAVSFALFSTVTIVTSKRESSKLPESVKCLAIGDTYKFLNREGLASRYYAKSLAASYGYNDEVSRGGLWNVCRTIYRDKKYEAASLCMDKAAGTGELTPKRLLSLADEAGSAGAPYDRHRILRGGAKFFPLSLKIRVEFGRSLLASKMYNEALAEARAALVISPGDLEAHSLQRAASAALQNK